MEGQLLLNLTQINEENRVFSVNDNSFTSVCKTELEHRLSDIKT